MTRPSFAILAGLFSVIAADGAVAHPGHVLPADGHDHGTVLVILLTAGIAAAVAAFVVKR